MRLNIWLIKLIIHKLLKAFHSNNSYIEFVAGPQLSEEAAIATEFCVVTGNLSKYASVIHLGCMHDTRLLTAMMKKSTRGQGE